jgi:hypothetical protein
LTFEISPAGSHLAVNVEIVARARRKLARHLRSQA